jgi:hypothetical protein
LEFLDSGSNLFLGFGLFLEDCESDLDGVVVRVIVGDELELITMDSERLKLADFPFKIEEHLLSDFLWWRISFQVFLF